MFSGIPVRLLWLSVLYAVGLGFCKADDFARFESMIRQIEAQRNQLPQDFHVEYEKLGTREHSDSYYKEVLPYEYKVLNTPPEKQLTRDPAKYPKHPLSLSEQHELKPKVEEKSVYKIWRKDRRYREDYETFSDEPKETKIDARGGMPVNYSIGIHAPKELPEEAIFIVSSSRTNLKDMNVYCLLLRSKEKFTLNENAVITPPFDDWRLFGLSAMQPLQVEHHRKDEKDMLGGLLYVTRFMPAEKKAAFAKNCIRTEMGDDIIFDIVDLNKDPNSERIAKSTHRYKFSKSQGMNLTGYEFQSNFLFCQAKLNYKLLNSHWMLSEAHLEQGNYNFLKADQASNKEVLSRTVTSITIKNWDLSPPAEEIFSLATTGLPDGKKVYTNGTNGPRGFGQHDVWKDGKLVLDSSDLERMQAEKAKVEERRREMILYPDQRGGSGSWSWVVAGAFFALGSFCLFMYVRSRRQSA